jgi:hypothetical protein
VGIILSGLLALVFLPSAAFVLVEVLGGKSGPPGMVVFAVVLAAIGGMGAFFFYRMAFTKPEATSARAHRIYSVVAVVVAGSMALGSLLLAAPAAQTATSFSLFFVALGVLAGTRNRRAASKRRGVRDGSI